MSDHNASADNYDNYDDSGAADIVTNHGDGPHSTNNSGGEVGGSAADDDDGGVDGDASSVVAVDVESDPNDFPKDGIRLSYILDVFVPIICGGEDAIRDKTTTEICEKIIKPYTQAQQISFCELLKRQELKQKEEEQHEQQGGGRQQQQQEEEEIDGDECSSKCTKLTNIVRKSSSCQSATAFISHAHSYKFLDVLCALKYHYRQSKRKKQRRRLAARIQQHRQQQEKEEENEKEQFSEPKEKIESLLEKIEADVEEEQADENDDIIRHNDDVDDDVDDEYEYDDEYIWFDLFSINQHNTNTKDNNNNNTWSFHWLSTTFKSAIGEFGKVIMVMRPWNDPIPFTRAWCVFEAYCAFVTHSKFEIALSPQDQDQFLQDIQDNDNNTGVIVHEMINSVRAENSTSSVESDRISIFEVIESTVGFDNLNAMVYKCYRGWFIQVATDALQEARTQQEENNDKDGGGGGVDETLRMLLVIGRLHRDQGNNELARKYLQEYYDLSKSNYGVESPVHVHSMYELAMTYFHQEDFDTHETLLVTCLEKRRSLLGPDDPSTLSTMNSLAMLYLFCERPDKIELSRSLFIECLNRQKEILGPTDRKTLATVNNLGLFYLKQEDYDEAEPLFVQCLEERRATLGDSHPSTLASINNLALLYGKQGELSKAEALHKECLKMRRVVLGGSHPRTQTSRMHLARIYKKQGKKSQSKNLYRQIGQKR